MKIILTENQFNRLNKSSQQITNAIVKYMNQYISNGNRKITPKSRNYGNLREDWCVDGKEVISAIYFFDKGKFRNGTLVVSDNIKTNLSNLLSVRQSYVSHVIEEWYDETMVPKFEEATGESGLSVNEILTFSKEGDCVPEPVKPEGITDEEMIDYIANNTLYSRDEVVYKVESGDEDLDELFLHIMDIQNGKTTRRI